MGNSSHNDSSRKGDGKTPVRRSGPNFWVLLLFIGVMIVALLTTPWPTESVIDYSFFLQQLRDNNNIQTVQLGETEATGRFIKAPPKPPRIGRDGTLEKQEGTLKDQFRVILPRDPQSREQAVGIAG